MNERQCIAWLVSIGLQSMSERDVAAPDGLAIEAMIAAGGDRKAETAEAIRQIMEPIE